jgi:hypothetical protein
VAGGRLFGRPTEAHVPVQTYRASIGADERLPHHEGGFTMARELTGANLLLLIRDHLANDIASLSREFGFEGSLSISYLLPRLEQLTQAGLIVDAGDGRYEASPNWPRIQGALGLSLTQCARMGPASLVVSPQFGAPDKLAKPIDVFVLMPFTEKLRPVWEDHIKKVVEAMGLTVKRADDFFTAHSIMADVWDAICGTRVIIADCTGRNPNVFYEIGVAHTIGKPVILTTQSADDVPFDLRHLRYIEYEYTPPGMGRFEATLTETLRNSTPN